jgi:hypothetical protein
MCGYQMNAATVLAVTQIQLKTTKKLLAGKRKYLFFFWLESTQPKYAKTYRSKTYRCIHKLEIIYGSLSSNAQSS